MQKFKKMSPWEAICARRDLDVHSALHCVATPYCQLNHTTWTGIILQLSQLCWVNTLERSRCMAPGPTASMCCDNIHCTNQNSRDQASNHACMLTTYLGLWSTNVTHINTGVGWCQSYQACKSNKPLSSAASHQPDSVWTQNHTHVPHKSVQPWVWHD